MLSIYRLPGIMPDEKIIKIVRQSFFVLFKKIIFFILLGMMFLAFLFLGVVNYSDLLNDPVYFPLIALFGSGFYLFVWLFFFFIFIDYYLDVFVITSERIISIRQEGFFSRIIAEQKIERVQDITSEVKGVAQTIFKFGNIYVQTAAEQERLYFKDISNPEEIRDVIIKLAETKHRSYEA